MNKLTRKILLTSELETPAFVYDEKALVGATARLRDIISQTGCKLLYALKPFAFYDALCLLASQVDGFAVSSIFEARLARIAAGKGTPIHVASPGLRGDQVSDLDDLCDYVTFNSIPQFKRLFALFKSRPSIGLRVNPGLSFVTDVRYDPCRPNSKLGVPINDLDALFRTEPSLFAHLDGLHFHTNCESSRLQELGATLDRILDGLSDRLLTRLRWLNLGGGYSFESQKSGEEFSRALARLQKISDIGLFIEPGASIIQNAGFVVSTVIDIFKNDGKAIAILDTTVNHMPEIFEYQYRPDVLGDAKQNPHRYILAGASCLAGDIFGTYSFSIPLEIGSRIVFENIGAYSLSKAHTFNGINLPTIYAHTRDWELLLKKRYTFQDFAQRCGVGSSC